MSYIKTWVERCDEHPDHQSGMVSNGMIQARMQEEIDDLRAEIERLFNEDTKTRHALKGWVFVCPDGGDEPTHERVAAVVAEVERLRDALRWYSDLSNHLPVERRNPGDPDPAVIILDEPPILLDGGTLARIALEGKP